MRSTIMLACDNPKSSSPNARRELCEGALRETNLALRREMSKAFLFPLAQFSGDCEKQTLIDQHRVILVGGWLTSFSQQGAIWLDPCPRSRPALLVIARIMLYILTYVPSNIDQC